MKKVLIVIPSYSKGGGAEKILSNILNNGDFSGYQIDIVEIDRGYNGIEVLPRNIKVIKSYYYEKYPNVIRLVLEQLGKRFPRVLRRYLVKKDDYDVEIMFEVMYPDIPFSKRNIKKIYWVHGSIEDFSNTWRENRFRQYFSDATEIVSISNKTEKSILDTMYYIKFPEGIPKYKGPVGYQGGLNQEQYFIPNSKKIDKVIKSYPIK